MRRKKQNKLWRTSFLGDKSGKYNEALCSAEVEIDTNGNNKNEIISFSKEKRESLRAYKLQ